LGKAYTYLSGASMSAAIRRMLPLLDRVIVERLSVQTKSVGGVLLPEKAQTKIHEGVVVAVGPGGRTPDGTLIPVTVSVGDKVMLPEWGGNPIKVEDKEFHIFRNDDILARLG